MIYAGRVLREIVSKPVSAAVALIELPATVNRSLREANELMEASRRQLEAIQSQTGNALDQAERMNELLARVVRLTEPIEMAQRGGEYVAGGLMRVIFGEGLEGAVEDSETVSGSAEWAALEVGPAGEAGSDAEDAGVLAGEALEQAGEADDGGSAAEQAGEPAREAGEVAEEPPQAGDGALKAEPAGTASQQPEEPEQGPAREPGARR